MAVHTKSKNRDFWLCGLQFVNPMIDFKEVYSFKTYLYFISPNVMNIYWCNVNNI